MEEKIEEQFVAIYQEAVEKAESIECSLEQFLYGLREIEERFKERGDMVRQELGR